MHRQRNRLRIFLLFVGMICAGPQLATSQVTPLTYISLTPNPAVHESLTPSTVRARVAEAVEAGMTYLYVAQTWNALEPQPGVYNFAEVDFHIELAAQYNLPVVFNLRLVDTNQRGMPGDVASRPFHEVYTLERLWMLFIHLVPRLQGRAPLMLLGNEIDAYFSQRTQEVQSFRSLLVTATRWLKLLAPGMQVSASVTIEGLPLLGTLLKPVAEVTDFLALTYYPSNPDYTMRHPESVHTDFDRILAAAGNKKVLLQEVGYATSALNNSSNEQQAEFLFNVFVNLIVHAERFWGAHFFLRSDLSSELVELFATYYGIPQDEPFKAYLRTLGLFDARGVPKPGWDIFRALAPYMRDARTVR